MVEDLLTMEHDFSVDEEIVRDPDVLGYPRNEDEARERWRKLIKFDLLTLKLEEVALSDEYFISRKLYPNVDFYSGLIYESMGFPTEMFTVLFAIGRTPGWLAHWNEMLEQDSRIARPRQLYTGPAVRDYVPLSHR